jgi:mRNA-degrading endonuclease RelE of RelBE toxin-antitoxin system
MKAMKKRVDVFIEKEVIRQAKRLAAEEGRSLSDVIQEALVFYIGSETRDHIKRLKAYKLFCEQPMRIGKKQFKKILGEDAWIKGS